MDENPAPNPEQHLSSEQRILLGRMLVGSLRRSSEITDSFSSWLLGGFGAAVALLVSQENHLGDRLPATRIDALLFLFAGSTVAALAAKWCAVSIAQGLGGISVRLEDLGTYIGIREGAERYEEVDKVMEALKSIAIASAIPGFQWVRRMRMRKTATDRLAWLRIYARRRSVQSVLTGLQTALFIAALAIVSWPRC